MNSKIQISLESMMLPHSIMMFSGTAEKYGAGVSSTLSKNAAVWVEENYLKGDHIESPVSATAGFRLSF